MTEASCSDKIITLEDVFEVTLMVKNMQTQAYEHKGRIVLNFVYRISPSLWRGSLVNIIAGESDGVICK